MYECVACSLSSSSSSIPHLGFIIPNRSSFSNGHQHLSKSNLKNSIARSTRGKPLRWDQEYLDQKRKIQKASQQATPIDDETSGDFLVGEKEEEKEEFLFSTKGEGTAEEEILKRNTIRRTMKRSNLIAKQVIGVLSAISLGFVSQLWVDVSSWLVVVVEVRPNLLTGEQERFLLKDIMQVGDVVLIEDESIVENEFKLIGLETLVGYNVVTPARRKIGRVRGYSFNVESGAIELLELDSFGMSIIPSSLVTTYALFIEDVLEVGSDTVVVHEAAASHIQRLTKGLWDMQSMGSSIDEFDEWPKPRKQHHKSKSKSGLGRKRSVSSRKLHQEMAEAANDWELPMDYL